MTGLSKNAVRRQDANLDVESEGTGMSNGPQEWLARNDGNEGWDDDDQPQANDPSPSYIDDPGRDLKTQYSHQPASGHNYSTFPNPNKYSSATSFPSSLYFPSPQTQQDMYVSRRRSNSPEPWRQQTRQFDHSFKNDSYRMLNSRDLGTSFDYAETAYNTTPQQTSYQESIAKSQLSSHSVNRNSSEFENSAQDESFTKGNEEAGYVTITKPGGYFKPGRIFRTKAEGANEDVQTLVVLQEGKDSAICAPLKKYNVDSSSYGYEIESRPLVFATGITPQLGPGEDQPTMGQFQVFVEGSPDRIDPKSRLDFSTTLKIDHKAKVETVGRIDRKHLKELKSAFSQVKEAKHPENYTRRSEVVPKYDENGIVDATSSWGCFEGGSSASRETSAVVRSNPGDNEARTMTKTIRALPIENVFEGYVVHPSSSFRRGKVFKVLWSEPLGAGRADDNGSDVTVGTELGNSFAAFGERTYHSVRRFVVVRAMEGHSLCVPILTYGYQGTAKPGVKPQHHAIIYTSSSGEPPPKELEGEEKLVRKPIRMKPSSLREKLAPESRINYSKIYTVEHNVKVSFIGRIHDDSLVAFVMDSDSSFGRSI